MNAAETWAILEALAWMAFVILFVVLGFCILVQAGFLPSTRSRASEWRVSLKGKRGKKRRARLGAPRIPGRSGAWNALVERHDPRRIRAVVVANHRRRWIVTFSFVVSVSLVTAVIFTLLREFAGMISADTTGPFVIAKNLGLVLAAAYGWLTIPALTAWSLRRIHRSRLPLEWRLLGAGHAISWLGDPKSGRAVTHERPQSGFVTTQKAGQLLIQLEAEAVDTLGRPRNALASSYTTWRMFDAPRLSLVLQSKARLLDRTGGAVAVEDLYSWVDELIEILVNKRTSQRVLSRTEIAPEVSDGSAGKRARVALNLPFWMSPAAALMVMSVLIFGTIIVAVTYPAAQPFLSENPAVADAVGWLATIAGTAVATYVASAMLRARAS